MRAETYTTLIALLASTGLRVSEALGLTFADITDDGLLIRETKFRKTRLVPLHDTAAAGLRHYLIRRRQLGAGDDHVFVGGHGRRLCFAMQRRQGAAFFAPWRRRKIVVQSGCGDASPLARSSHRAGRTGVEPGPCGRASLAISDINRCERIGRPENPDPRRQNATRHGANTQRQRRLLGCPASEIEPVCVDDRPGKRVGIRSVCRSPALRNRLCAGLPVSGRHRFRWRGYAPVRFGRKSNSGMPSVFALSARLSLIPEPGKTTTPSGNTARRLPASIDLRRLGPRPEQRGSPQTWSIPA